MKNKLQQCSSLVDIARFRATHTPEQLSYNFVNKDTELTLNYAQLDERARAIATYLQAQGAQHGDRILLLFSPGLPLITAFFGCLYAGCIAVPIYPPAQNKLMDKAHRIINNSQPRCVLMTADHLEKFTQRDAKGIPYLDKVPCFALENIELDLHTLWQPLSLNKKDIAFLQYTSGSTMHPKGVVITHHNLLDNIEKIRVSFDLSEESITLSWLPPHHDMGLIGYILSPVGIGYPGILQSPFSFLQNPLSWLRNISKYKATVSGAPNFAYDYCVKRIKEEKKQGLDLSSWRIASNGAEPIRKETLERFYHAFKNYGLRKESLFPCYGLAEATLLVSGHTPDTPYHTLTLAKEPFQNNCVHFANEDTPHGYQLVSSGKMMQTVKIINPDTLTLCAPDEIGEIWVHSPSVAKGYWLQDEETEHTFHGKISGDTSNLAYLRTGDLGFVHDEELYVTGRIKDLIILYGKNHYPQDIEYSILHAPVHQLLGKCAAFITQNNHEYQLTVMVEVKNRFMAPEEKDNLFNTLFELIYQDHQLELHHIVLVPLKSMPHTTSGKIRRNFCRLHLLDNTLPVIAQWQLNKADK